MIRAIVIAGPTAGGKSSLAIRLAKDLGGIVINADSMQVYSDLRVISARPSAAEEAEVPHRLYGVLDGSEVCSAADWSGLAMQEIDRAWKFGKLPILVGGTGMYFKVLIEGIADIPEVPDAIRQAVRDECRRLGPDHLHRELAACDPETATRLAPTDSQRICRALEVCRATDRPLSDFHKHHKPGPLTALDAQGEIIKLVLVWPREQLYERCNRRFDLMLEEGGLEEVEAFRARRLPADLPSMKALGVPTLLSYLQGDSDLETATENSKMQTRRFAKRQMTWFRNQFPDWQRLDAQHMETEYSKLLQKITKKGID